MPSSDFDLDLKNQMYRSEFHEHNMIVYPGIETFRDMYCEFSARYLQPEENAIVLLVTHYEPIDKVRDNLRKCGIDVNRHEKDGSLLILDSARAYHSDKDHSAVWKLVQTLIARATKEGKSGVVNMSDLGSFFLYDKIEELLQYEQGITKKPKINFIGTCSYHAGDYANLTEQQKNILAKSHFRVIK
jgi:hypothetical protein